MRGERGESAIFRGATPSRQQLPSCIHGRQVHGFVWPVTSDTLLRVVVSPSPADVKTRGAALATGSGFRAQALERCSVPCSGAASCVTPSRYRGGGHGWPSVCTKPPSARPGDSIRHRSAPLPGTDTPNSPGGGAPLRTTVPRRTARGPPPDCPSRRRCAAACSLEMAGAASEPRCTFDVAGAPTTARAPLNYRLWLRRSDYGSGDRSSFGHDRPALIMEHVRHRRVMPARADLRAHQIGRARGFAAGLGSGAEALSWAFLPVGADDGAEDCRH